MSNDGKSKSAPSQASGAPVSEAGDAIGQRLKNYYDEMVTEPVPDRFLELLNQLDSTKSEGDGKSDPETKK